MKQKLEPPGNEHSRSYHRVISCSSEHHVTYEGYHTGEINFLNGLQCECVSHLRGSYMRVSLLEFWCFLVWGSLCFC